MAGRASARAAGCAVILVVSLGCEPPREGTLALAVVDESGAPTPARIELLDAEGRARIPVGALPLSFECYSAPLPEWAAALTRAQSIENPHSGTRQFYADRPLRIALPEGRHRLRVFKGIEYEVSEHGVEVRGNAETRLEVRLERWSHLAAKGWYAADDHLHITRLSATDDTIIARWMRAEDLDVANLLQMGTVDQFSVTPQRAFGDAGAYREGDTLLLAGQEHPRTHLLGHTITLGAREAIDHRERYALYRDTFRDAVRLGGVPGFAHFGQGPARDGLAITTPDGQLGFVEVLQFEYPGLDVWYELLTLGVRLAPTAGTDFPCGPWSLPGRERFYTRVEGALTRESFVAGLRQARTFVTNGPLLELRAGGVGIGGTLRLSKPGRVAVAGRVRFDPSRDAVTDVALVANERPLPIEARRTGPGEWRIEGEIDAEHALWLALRADGDKRGETPLGTMLPAWALRFSRRLGGGASITAREHFAAARELRPSFAHTAPIWIEVEGRPALRELPRARRLARAWRDRLEALEARLGDERLEESLIWDWFPYSDGLPESHLRRHRSELRDAIRAARAFYE